MKTCSMLFMTLCTVALLLCACPQPAAAADDSGDLRAYIEILRSDLNASKVRILNEALRLTEEEGKAFWPIYREYEAESFTLADARLELTEEFITFQNSDTRDPDHARLIADKWFALREDRLKLWRKYYEKISKAVSPIRAAQFIQIEHEISLYIDLGIASEAPLLGGPETGMAPGSEEKNGTAAR